MIISIKHEMIVFWSAFVCGQVMFFLFDFFRALRKTFRHPKAMVAIEDSLFCLIAFKIFFDTLYITNNGHLRWYVLSSLISGLVIYFFLLSKYMIRLWEFLIKFIRLFLIPVAKIIYFIKSMILSIFKAIKSRILSIFYPLQVKIRQFATKKPLNTRKTRL